MFVGRVIHVENQDGSLMVDGHCDKTLLQTVKVGVTEQLLGTVGATVTLHAGDLNGYYFTTGRSYFNFRRSHEGWNVHVSGYGQTKLLTDARDDIAYIRSYPTHPSGSEIFGQAWGTESPEEDRRMMVPRMRAMKGTKIAIRGQKDYEVTVDSKGMYRIDALPPGKYEVTLQEKSLVWPSASQTVEVLDKGCAAVNFRVDPFRSPSGELIKPR